MNVTTRSLRIFRFSSQSHQRRLVRPPILHLIMAALSEEHTALRALFTAAQLNPLGAPMLVPALSRLALLNGALVRDLAQQGGARGNLKAVVAFGGLQTTVRGILGEDVLKEVQCSLNACKEQHELQH